MISNLCFQCQRDVIPEDNVGHDECNMHKACAKAKILAEESFQIKCLCGHDIDGRAFLKRDEVEEIEWDWIERDSDDSVLFGLGFAVPSRITELYLNNSSLANTAHVYGLGKLLEGTELESRMMNRKLPFLGFWLGYSAGNVFAERISAKFIESIAFAVLGGGIGTVVGGLLHRKLINLGWKI